MRSLKRGIGFSITVQIVTLLAIIGVWIFGLNKIENQLLLWMKDAEIERKANHDDVVILINELDNLSSRVTYLEQYNLRNDPEFLMPNRNRINRGRK